MDKEQIIEPEVLEIIYQDAHLVAINKPHGLLVHRSRIASNTDTFALQILRDQLNVYVYPIHRLDRKTSGVLIFALDKKTASVFQEQLSARSVEKKYLAIVRGFFPDDISVLDYPLTNDRGKKQEALTYFKKLKQVEIDVPFGKHKTSRYSLVEVVPKTGRMHQIRKHLSHLGYPIIGDRPHGCNKQNKLFKEKWEMITMLLHAKEWKGIHPITEKRLEISANLSPEFERTKTILEF